LSFQMAPTRTTALGIRAPHLPFSGRLSASGFPTALFVSFICGLCSDQIFFSWKLAWRFFGWRMAAMVPLRPRWLFTPNHSLALLQRELRGWVPDSTAASECDVVHRRSAGFYFVLYTEFLIFPFFCRRSPPWLKVSALFAHLPRERSPVLSRF